ncbi:hypothetical protein J6590_015762 [Homalodisca vitripennis]|nr:hypothetical protein J6590_015762 [Homalodisca vitripennis]
MARVKSPAAIKFCPRLVSFGKIPVQQTPAEALTIADNCSSNSDLESEPPGQICKQAGAVVQPTYPNQFRQEVSVLMHLPLHWLIDLETSAVPSIFIVLRQICSDSVVFQSAYRMSKCRKYSMILGLFDSGPIKERNAKTLLVLGFQRYYVEDLVHLNSTILSLKFERDVVELRDLTLYFSLRYFQFPPPTTSHEHPLSNKAKAGGGGRRRETSFESATGKTNKRVAGKKNGGGKGALIQANGTSPGNNRVMRVDKRANKRLPAVGAASATVPGLQFMIGPLMRKHLLDGDMAAVKVLGLFGTRVRALVGI